MDLDDFLPFILAMSIVFWLCMAALCARIAQKNGRDPVIWGVVGCLTSLIGLLILAASIDADKKRKEEEEKIQ